MKFCPDCGCENIDKAQFCRNCGSKFNHETEREVREVSQKPQEIVQSNPILENSIVKKLFFKKDKYTGELRFAKAKSISIIMYLLLFIYVIVSPITGGWFIHLLVAIIFAFIFALPVFVIGFVMGVIIDKIQNG